MSARILVVEDDPMNAKLFEMILGRKAGFDVSVTEDPAVVVEAARRGEVDLIVMDISLSNSTWRGQPVDGLAITRLLKQDAATRVVPVLLATAHAMKGSKEKFLADSGADDYVSKPIVNSDDLIVLVRTLLRPRSHALPPAGR